MELLLEALGLFILVLIHLSATWYAAVDAADHDMDPRRWRTRVLLIPIFGFFWYVFERDERNRDDDRDEMFADGPFEVHESRADDTGLKPGTDDTSEEER